MSFTVTLPSPIERAGGDFSNPALSPSVIRLKAKLAPTLDTLEAHTAFDSALEKVDPTHEVRGLKRDIIGIKVLFSKLYHDFEKHDREVRRLCMESSGPRSDVGPLAPKWAALRKRFNQLINESQTNAVDAYIVLDQYVAVLTAETLESRGLHDFKSEVGNFLSRIEDKTQEADSIKESFSELAEDVRSFKNDIEETLFAIQPADKRVHLELEAARQDVQALHERLAQVTKEMTSLGIACIACLSTGALSAGVFLLKLSPQAATAAVSSLLAAVPLGVSAAKSWRETRGLTKEIGERERAITELRKKADALASLKDSLKHSSKSLDNLADKIDAISGIWHTIKTDMLELRSALSLTVAGEVTSYLKTKLDVARTIYQKLVISLREYAREVHDLSQEEECPDVFGLGEGDSEK
ncbi:hypothetical protein C8Q73DRAFT_794375 [Cubamyces lactineus]|nr:hypothetical protein C8Q73DRAFT_794375 [Cubamyces lactineus]